MLKNIMLCCIIYLCVSLTVNKNLHGFTDWLYPTQQCLVLFGADGVLEKLGYCLNGPNKQEGQGPEWDLVSHSIDQKQLLVGEAKWTSRCPTVDWIWQRISELRTKGFPPVEHHPHAQIQYVLFLPEFPKGLDLPPDVRLINAEDILNGAQ